MENENEKIMCHLCDSRKVLLIGTKNSFKIYRCETCNLVFIHPVPTSIDVYDESYFSGAEKGFGYTNYDADKEPMIPTFNTYLDLVEKNGISNGKLLDIGSATGFFMSMAKRRGFDVYGVEVSKFASDIAKSKGLHSMTDEDLKKFPDGYFDVITMFDVLEHLPDPKNYLNEMKRLLRKNGLIVVNTPDADSMFAKLMGIKWHLIVPPEHINLFSPKNLSKYLSEIGFVVVENTTIGKFFTPQYVFKTLARWQGLRIWEHMADISSKNFLSKIRIPINLYDNFLLILKKND